MLGSIYCSNPEDVDLLVQVCLIRVGAELSLTPLKVLRLPSMMRAEESNVISEVIGWWKLCKGKGG